MKHIKILGAAVTVALALSAAVGAASASASAFVTAEDPATFEGSMTKSAVVGNTSWQVTCSGFALNSSAHTGPTYSLATTATDGACSSGGSVKMNSCKFEFNPGAKESASEYAGEVTIGPVGCGAIVLTANPFGGTCEFSYTPQSGLSATFTNVAGSPDKVNVALQGSGLDYNAVGAPCGAKGSSHDGVIDATWTLQAKNLKGSLIDAQIERTGFLISGEESPQFEAHEYPEPLSGQQDAEHNYVLTMTGPSPTPPAGVPVKCEGVGFSAELLGATNALPVNAENTGCYTIMLNVKFPITFSMNSCHYVFNVQSGAYETYPGLLDIACSEEGDGIEVKIYASALKQKEGKTFCVVKMAPQTGLEGVVLANAGEGVAFFLESVEPAYTRTGSAMCGAESGTATYSGATWVRVTP